MKKLILFSLLALTACKKEEVKPTPIPTNTEHTFEVKGLSTCCSQMILWKNGNEGSADSIYNDNFHPIKLKKGDKVVFTDSDYKTHKVTMYIDGNIKLDTLMTPNQLGMLFITYIQQ